MRKKERREEELKRAGRAWRSPASLDWGEGEDNNGDEGLSEWSRRRGDWRKHLFCLNANCHLFSPLRLLSFLLCFQLFPPPSLFLIHCFTPLFCCHCLLCTCGCLFLCTASSEEPSLQPLNCACSPVHSLCPITPFASSPGLPSHFSYLFHTCLFF